MFLYVLMVFLVTFVLRCSRKRRLLATTEYHADLSMLPFNISRPAALLYIYRSVTP